MLNDRLARAADGAPGGGVGVDARRYAEGLQRRAGGVGQADVAGHRDQGEVAAGVDTGRDADPRAVDGGRKIDEGAHAPDANDRSVQVDRIRRGNRRRQRKGYRIVGIVGRARRAVQGGGEGALDIEAEAGVGLDGQRQARGVGDDVHGPVAKPRGEIAREGVADGGGQITHRAVPGEGLGEV